MIPRAVPVVLFGCFLFACELASCKEPPRPEDAEPVRAYFLGYENDDLVFRIFNEWELPINVKGLSFRHQVLYRPVEKEVVVQASNTERPYLDVIFRTTGDFVWSENHMTMFTLAYELPEVKERRYGKIYPELSSSVLEKELVTETVP